MDAARVALIGCGNIARKAYVPGCRHYDALDLVACADMDVDRARAFAQENDIAFGGSVEDILARDDIDAVLNLTIPAAHAAVDGQIIASGKHCWSEKPLALDPTEVAPVLESAAAAKLRLGCAPDTILGAGLQRCRALVDEGAIGRPLWCSAFMAGPGHEHWHPDPAFYYQPGGGPLMDMGPYYLSALISILGPIKQVSAFTGSGFESRTVTSEAKYGTVIPVAVDTQVNATMQFASGVIGSLIMSFDTVAHHLPRLELHGTDGSLAMSDPNSFRGPVLLRKKGSSDWKEITLTHEEGQRGAGLADMLSAQAHGRPHRTSAALAYHVLDVMETLVQSGKDEAVCPIASTCERPSPVPPGLAVGTFD